VSWGRGTRPNRDHSGRPISRRINLTGHSLSRANSADGPSRKTHWRPS
jgi:hypothetical protein